MVHGSDHLKSLTLLSQGCSDQNGGAAAGDEQGLGVVA